MRQAKLRIFNCWLGVVLGMFWFFGWALMGAAVIAWTHEAGEYVPLHGRLLAGLVMLLVGGVGLMVVRSCVKQRRRILEAMHGVRGFPVEVGKRGR